MIERRLRREGGRAASLLQEVATSPDLGAPIARRHAAVRRPPSVLRTWLAFRPIYREGADAVPTLTRTDLSKRV